MDVFLPADALFDEVMPFERSLGIGEALFTQGGATFGLFRLISGQIRLSRVTPSGAEVTMHLVRPGEMFAEASLFSRHYHCDAIAVQNSTVQIYQRDVLIERFNHSSDALWSFTSSLAQQVRDLRMRLTLRQIRSANQRILQALELWVDERGCYKLNGTYKHFAEELGLTHEALYRALANLESSGHILRTKDTISLLPKMRR